MKKNTFLLNPALKCVYSAGGHALKPFGDGGGGGGCGGGVLIVGRLDERGRGRVRGQNSAEIMAWFRVNGKSRARWTLPSITRV